MPSEALIGDSTSASCSESVSAATFVTAASVSATSSPASCFPNLTADEDIGRFISGTKNANIEGATKSGWPH